jgi:hypothetical protein
LLLHFPRRYGSRIFQQSIGEGRFTMIDVGYDGKIADLGNWYDGHRVANILE